MSRIFEITDRVSTYAPKADIDLINRAYVFAAHAHADQTRHSGEPYLTHPLAVADILASLKLDEASIITGLLHDTVEDTHVSLEEIEHRFGKEVAKLVDGVTKIGQIRFRSSEHKQAENFRKMILATAQDLRVLLVKLADRLHNMRTLGFMPEHKRKGVAEETMQLYAPLAHRLGIHWIKQEMEDLAFSHLDPDAYRVLVDEMKDHIEGLHQTQERLESIIQEALDRQGLKASVQGRMKHMYSVHDKMERKHIDFNEIYDLVAFRIIVEDMPTCYQALGIIHSLYRPVPGRFKDYIALPKPNGYQSLHTSVIGPENYRIEVQIRTESMHTYAEDGIAAHWLYKDEQAEERDQKSFQWLKQLTELLQETENPGEFMESARLDLFVQEVYVFSRDGEIFALPRGARPLDFAYNVHTDVGHHCIGVRINGELADFQTRLHNGDQIEILTSDDQTPSRQWLQYVETPKARQAIRQWFRRQERETSIGIGEQVLRESIGKADVGKSVLQRLQLDSQEALKEALGRGEIPINQLLDAVDQDRTRPLRIKGLARTLMHAADCCHPIPGDPVLGQFQSGRGMIIHHRKCPEVESGAKQGWLDVHWSPQEGQSFPTGIGIKTRNERGMLARVSNCIAESAANIDDIKIHQRGGSVTDLHILIEVADRTHLATVLRNIKATDGVVSVRRENRVGLTKARGRGFGRAIRDMVFRGRGKE
ncbi:MAG: RelA/SpoT family protein [Mariprofundaceae bacterium]